MSTKNKPAPRRVIDRSKKPLGFVENLSDLLRFADSMETGPLTLGTMLRGHRQAEETTLKDFAAKLGISSAHLSDIEAGRRRVSVERAARFAEAMGQSPGLLVTLCLREMVADAGVHGSFQFVA